MVKPMNKRILALLMLMVPALVKAQTNGVSDHLYPTATWLQASSDNTPAEILNEKNKAAGACAKKNPAHVVQTKGNNFSTFTRVRYNRSAEVAASNKGYERDPELGVLFANAPCSDCYELLDKRTETQKYFVKEGTNGSHFILQSGSAPLHYKDARGRWRTVTDRAEEEKSHRGVFATKGRAVNVVIDTREGFTRMSNSEGSLNYNRKLELIYVQPDGTEQSLGMASWSKYSGGDDGVLVTDAWPGINIEISVNANFVKTNFLVNNAMPAYANGKLVIRDHPEASKGLSLSNNEGHEYVGDLYFANGKGDDIFQMQKANAYELNNKAAAQDLAYKAGADNILDIEVPGSLLDKAASSYPLVIDPLLVSGTASTGGFTYSASSGIYYCTNSVSVTVPGGTTLTDITGSYAYTATAGSFYFQGDVTFAVNGGCTSSKLRCPSWTPDGLSGTPCGTTGMSFWDHTGLLDAAWGVTSGCLPTPGCSAYSLTFQMYNSQSRTPTSDCVQTVFATRNPFIVNLIGDASVATITPSGPTSVCVGSTVSLTGSPSGGTWNSSNPGVGSVNSSGFVTGVSAGTTTISYTASGVCTPATRVVTVVTTPVVAAISGGTSVCEGATITLSDATAGGTWSSSATGTASVSSSGDVTGVSAGTVTIYYAVTNACSLVSSSQVVTVNASPDAGTITGSPGMCMGASTTLSDAVAGGTWSSTITSVATVGTSGIVDGIATGTSTISYTVSNAFCTSAATQEVTVSVMPVVTAILGGPANICQGATSTLSDASAGGAWSSTNTAVAIVGTGGIVTGITGGTATISYTIANSCATVAATTTATVNPIFMGIPGTIKTIAGTGTVGYSGDGGAATAAQVWDVNGITKDTMGNVFFATFKPTPSFHTILRGITPSGIIHSYVESSGTTDAYHGVVSDDHSNLFFGDDMGDLYYVNAAGSYISLITFDLGYQSYFCVDKAWHVYVGDNLDAKVYKVDTFGTKTLIAGTGGYYSGDGGPATAAGTGYTQGVAIDPSGNIYLTCIDPGGGNSRVRKINTSGIITTIAGTGTDGFSGDGGPSAAAQISAPGFIQSDIAGNIYFRDGSRIRMIDAITGNINTIAGTDMTTYNGDNIPALTANIGISAFWVDKQGDIYITDQINFRVREIPASAGVIGGGHPICVGDTLELTDTLYPSFGSWSSGNPSIATVGSTGILTGVSAGIVNISYILTSSCSSTYSVKSVTVHAAPAPPAITGATTVCMGSTGLLNNAIAGGIWSSTATGVATVSSAGLVSGITLGTATISYVVTNSCGTGSISTIVTVNTLPATAGTITGTVDTVCMGSSITLTDATTGGTWSSASGLVSVVSPGVMHGLTAGIDTVVYTVSNSCGAVKAKYVLSVINCTLGMNATGISNEVLKVYPNPSTGGFTLNIATNTAEETRVVIRNVVGETIAELTATSNHDTPVTLNQPEGIYLITVYTENRIYTARIAISK